MGPPDSRAPDWRKLLAVLLVLFAGGLSLTVVLIDDDGDGRKDGIKIITTKVDGDDPGTAKDDVLVLGAPAQDYLTEELDVSPEELADPTTPVPAAENPESELSEPLRDDGEKPDPPTALDGDPLPLAAQDFPGCVTAFVRNMSSRYGVKPTMINWHITAGPDRPGPSDNIGLTGMSNNPANGVSWHFSIGSKDGICYYNVPLSMSAWTAAAANRVSVNIEVINQGTEPYFVTGAGKERLLQVTREIAKRADIPLRQGRYDECRVVRFGIEQHKDIDQRTTCAGGHNDADNCPGSQPNCPRRGEVKALIAELARPPVRPITKRDRSSCRKVYAYRKRPASRRTRGAVARQKARRKFVRSHDLKCVKGEPRRIKSG